MEVGIDTLVNHDIVLEELCAIKICECCCKKSGSWLLAQKSGIVTVIEHLCQECLHEIILLLQSDHDIEFYGMEKK